MSGEGAEPSLQLEVPMGQISTMTLSSRTALGICVGMGLRA